MIISLGASLLLFYNKVNTLLENTQLILVKYNLISKNLKDKEDDLFKEY